MEKENKPAFDYEAFKKQADARLKKGETLLGKECVFTPLIKEFLEEALDGELEAHIDSQEESNRKSGKGRKRVKTSVGIDILAIAENNYMWKKFDEDPTHYGWKNFNDLAKKIKTRRDQNIK